MSPGLARLAIPVLAVVGFAAMLGWFGWRLQRPDEPQAPAAGQSAAVAPVPAPTMAEKPPAPAPRVEAATKPAPPATPEPPSPLPGDKVPPASAAPRTGAAASAPAPSDPSKTATPSTPDKAADAKAVVPSFDVVRVEPTGESVIAGRAAPGATVDLLSNGSNLARAIADPSGLFAFVPPPLPAGSHEILLQTIAPDGTRARSAQSVTVVVAAKHDSVPLVAVTTPGQPTVVLSRPGDKPARPDDKPAAPDTKTVASAAPRSDPAPGPSAQAPPAAAPAQSATASPEPAPAPKPGPPAPRPEVRIATVEAEGTGRLFVAGTAAPGATLRLYLNDSFVAPGGTGPQGQVSFTIERGIKPGDYQVRLDDVDPMNGAVRSRAEVPFSVPVPVAVAAAEAADAAGAVPPPAAPGMPPAPSPRRSSVARAFPPAPNEGSTGASPNPSGSPAKSGSVSPPSPAPSPKAEPTEAAAKAEEGPGFASRQDSVGAVVVPEITTTIVSRGDNLWRISKRTYGRGTRYTVIYGANQPQIRDPALIYPGQIFVLPQGESQAAR